MTLALTADDARQAAEAGKMAVFLGVESGFDHEGDLDVLRALYRLGLRSVQFGTQTCCNAFADCEIGGTPQWNGINDRGRDLVQAMNELGILIDVTHATPQAQLQIIEASDKPVTCSHTSMAAVSGAGMSDELLQALCAKGGLVGIIGTSASLSTGYRQWLAAHPAKAKAFMAPVLDMVGFEATLIPKPLNHGEFGNWLDTQARWRHLRAFRPWQDDPDTLDLVATPQDWAAHVAHVVNTVGTQHVGIGLDLVGGRSCVPRTASGYPKLLTAVANQCPTADLEGIAHENWLRLMDAVLRP